MLKKNSINQIYEELDKAYGYMLRNDFNCEYSQKVATYVLEVHSVASKVLKDMMKTLDSMNLVVKSIDLLENANESQNLYADFGLKIKTTNLGCLSQLKAELFDYNVDFLENKLTNANKHIEHIAIQEDSEYFEMFIWIGLYK